MEFDENQRLAMNQLDNGKILCAEVGSGKSRVSIAYYYTKECGGSFNGSSFSPMTHPKDLYIITTAKKRDIHDWELELAPFGIDVNTCKEQYGITIIIDSWNNIKKYEDAKDSFFIFDEQRLVGNGAWVKSFYKITGSGRNSSTPTGNRWILLSATPGDKWEDYIPVFVANKFYKNSTDFKSRHIAYARFSKFPKVDHYINEPILKMLRNRLLVDIEVHREAVKHDYYITVEHDKDMIKQVMKNRWNPYTDEPFKTASELCYTLRKIVNSDNNRLDAVRSLIMQNPKTIIFYSFDYELELLRDMLDNMNIAYSEWNGHKHQLIPKEDRWVYLVNYSSGAEGWNCIETDTIIFYSLSYSYRTTTQAKGRIDRRNTKFKDLNYYFIRTTAWIDRAISKSLEDKKEFNEKDFEVQLGFA